MAQDNVFQGEIDPEIAALLGTSAPPKNGGGGIPDFEHLFSDEASEEAPAEETEAPDLSASGFPEITKNLEEVPHKAFEDPN